MKMMLIFMDETDTWGDARVPLAGDEPGLSQRDVGVDRLAGVTEPVIREHDDGRPLPLGPATSPDSDPADSGGPLARGRWLRVGRSALLPSPFV